MLKRREGSEHPLFDQVHGYGWRLLNLGDRSIESLLSEELTRYFSTALSGRCVSISAEEDFEGEYRDWFHTHMALDHVVLIRPDFYVFGHAPTEEVDTLVQNLRSKLFSARDIGNL